VKLPAVFRRWRALRAPQLSRSSPEGAIVQATGVVRELDEPLIAPLSGRQCVVALTTYTTGDSNSRVNTLTVIERLQTRRFQLDTGALRVIVEPGAVELPLPARLEGRNREITVVPGERVIVVGSVLRDGSERPRDDLAFRDTRPTCMLVGGRAHPVVITA